MNILDLILLIGLGGFVLAGFWFGIIHMVGAFVGLVFGIWAASRFAGPVADWLANLTGWNENLLLVLAFVLSYAIAARLAGLALWFVEKIFHFIAIIPFLKTFNRLLGAALGFVEGMLTLGLALYVASRYPISADFTALLEASTFAPRFQAVGAVLAPLLPDAIRALQSVI